MRKYLFLKLCANFSAIYPSLFRQISMALKNHLLRWFFILKCHIFIQRIHRARYLLIIENRKIAARKSRRIARNDGCRAAAEIPSEMLGGFQTHIAVVGKVCAGNHEGPVIKGLDFGLGHNDVHISLADPGGLAQLAPVAKEIGGIVEEIAVA